MKDFDQYQADNDDDDNLTLPGLVFWSIVSAGMLCALIYGFELLAAYLGSFTN